MDKEKVVREIIDSYETSATNWLLLALICDVVLERRDMAGECLEEAKSAMDEGD
jgi:hypothetical protein